MKIKSFLLGFLVCYIFCFLVLLGISIFNNVKPVSFGKAPDVYYDFSDELDSRINKISQYNLSDIDNSCLVSLKEFKNFSNDTSVLISVSLKKFAMINSKEAKTIRNVYDSCGFENIVYDDNELFSKYYSIVYFYDLVYKKAYYNYQFILPDTDYYNYNYYVGFSSTKTTELELISYVLDMMEAKYE